MPVVEGSDGTTIHDLPRLRMGVMFTYLKPGLTPNSNSIHDYYVYILGACHQDVDNAYISIRPGWTVRDVKRILQLNDGLCLNDGTPLTDTDNLSAGTVLYTVNGVDRKPEEPMNLIMVVDKLHPNINGCDSFWKQVWDIDTDDLPRNFNYHELTDDMQTWSLIQKHLQMNYPNLKQWWEAKMLRWEEGGRLEPNPNYDWYKHFQLRDATGAVVGSAPPHPGLLCAAVERVVILMVQLDEGGWCTPQTAEDQLRTNTSRNALRTNTSRNASRRSSLFH